MGNLKLIGSMLEVVEYFVYLHNILLIYGTLDAEIPQCILKTSYVIHEYRGSIQTEELKLSARLVHINHLYSPHCFTYLKSESVITNILSYLKDSIKITLKES